MHVKPVSWIIKLHNIKSHYYVEAYMGLKLCDKWSDISIEAGIADITTWMNSNILHLNKDNTLFIVFSSKQCVKNTENFRIKLGSSYINLS